MRLDDFYKKPSKPIASASDTFKSHYLPPARVDYFPDPPPGYLVAKHPTPANLRDDSWVLKITVA